MKIAIIYNLPEKLTNSRDALADEEAYFTSKAVKESLDGLHEAELFRITRQGIGRLKEFDLVFNLAENTAGCDMSEEEIGKFMEDNKILFTGAGSDALRDCLDKALTKKRLLEKKIPTPRFQAFETGNELLDNSLKFPLIVKPLREDGSIGIDDSSYVNDEPGLRKKVREIIKKYKEPALAEEYIEGREINAAMLGDEILPLSEIVFELPEGKPKILTYDCKWLSDSDEYKKTMGKCPIEIDEEVKTNIIRIAHESVRAMGCRDYARVDFRVTKEGLPYVLEVNPNPCINPDGTGFVRSANTRGYSYKDMIRKIVGSALGRKK